MPGKLARMGHLDSLRARIGGLLTTGAGRRGIKKPATLSYGLEERPPAVVTWVSAAQHVGVCAIFMVYPLIIARQAMLPADELGNVLQLAFLVLAIATLLQALPRGPIGSRMLAPAIFTGVYLAPSLQAGKDRRPASGLGHDHLCGTGRDHSVPSMVAPASFHPT